MWIEPVIQADYVRQLLAGNRRALARTISLVEDGAAEAPAMLSALYQHTGRAHVIGVTGAPGTGKSTLVNALARAYRADGRTVGVIAVDPTSPFSGGALLGDRVRMRDLAGDPGIFIRSMATRGNLGGLAHATADVISVLDAAGFERILVETVGVGQAEIDIASAAHTTIVVEAPGLGDEVQAIKAGVLEIADIFAVNKADREGADHTVMALQMMQGLTPAPAGHHQVENPGTANLPRQVEDSGVPNLFGGFSGQRTRAPDRRHPAPGPQSDGGWLPPICKTVAPRGEGVETLHAWVEAHAGHLRATGGWTRRATAHAAAELEHILADRLMARLRARLSADRFAQMVSAIAQRAIDPYSAADQLLAQFV
jgi:LAO/AO transport system kinase